MFGRCGRLPLDVMARADSILQQDLPGYVKEHLEQLEVVWDATSKALLRNSLHSVKKMDLKYDAGEEFRPGDMVLLKKGSMVDNPRMHPKTAEHNDGPFM